MKKCPKCGGTEFTASQVQKHRVIVNGNGKFIRNEEMMSNDPIAGPYVCNSCNAEYQRLDELIEESEYDHFHYSGKTERREIQNIRPVADGNFLSTLCDYFRTREDGYYTYSATSTDGEKERAGMIRVCKDPFGEKKVDIAEEWLDGYDRISMNAASALVGSPFTSINSTMKGVYITQIIEGGCGFYAYPKIRIVKSGLDVEVEIETINPFVTYRCILSVRHLADIVVRYKCCDPDSYDPDSRILYSRSEMRETYQKKVDKSEYPDYECWLADMLKSGVFVKL